MWLQRYTKYLLGQTWLALAFVFAVSFVPMLGVLGILYAALATLRKGIIEGALMAVAATVPFVLTFAFTEQRDPAVPLMLWAGVGVAVLSNLLTYVFAVLLERKVSWSIIFQLAALLGVLFVSVVHLMFPDVASWWQMELHRFYMVGQQAAQAAGDVAKEAQLSADQLQSIEQTKDFATGMMTAGVIFNALVQLVAARWWEAIVFNPGSLQKELHRIRLSHLAGGLFIVSLILSYTGNAVVLDVMPIAYILFCVAGMSLIHSLFKMMQSQTRWFWLLLLYVGILFTMPVSVMMVAFLALADVWLDLRKRVKAL